MINIHDKKINQSKDSWVADILTGSVSLKNISINDGGLVHVNGVPGPTDMISLQNVSNDQETAKYVVMIWPQRPDGQQVAYPKLVWDNTGYAHEIKQGPYEAAFRGKIDDAHIIGVKFRGYLTNGAYTKQIVQIRHGKKWVFDGCEFADGLVDIGQQKTAQPDGTSVYETSQHVGSVTFNHCTFHAWTGPNEVVHRCPGVDHIIFNNCIDPHGKTFSKTI